jgi:hypothetical protein
MKATLLDACAELDLPVKLVKSILMSAQQKEITSAQHTMVNASTKLTDSIVSGEMKLV